MLALTVAVTLLFAALTAGVAAADPVRLCAPPQPKPYDFCQKGAMLDESSIDDCRARARAGKPGSPRLIVDGTSVPLSATAWTCVELPDRRVRLQVANGRRTVGSWKLDPRATCASKVFRVVGPNFYGAMYTTCAKRGSPAIRAAAGS